MAFLTEYGLFLAKTLTFLLAIGAVILILFWTVEKNLPEEQKAIKERSKK